jgi:hypothetical protein
VQVTKTTTMKIHTQLLITAAVVVAGTRPLTAQSTVWTYQGRLSAESGPATGTYDLQFAVFDAAVSGTQQGPTLTNSAVSASNGLFTVSLDFGAGVFTGPDRWLAIGVRTNGAAVTFTLLTPRQRLTATPYALFAPNAATAATATGLAPSTVSAGQLNTLNAPGAGQILSYTAAGLVWTNAAAAAAAWRLNGNAGVAPGVSFVGTTDNQPLELKTFGTRSMRFEPNTNFAPNVIGGAPNNFVQPGVVGATIGGGGATNYNTGVLGLGYSSSNAIRSDFGVVGGGIANLIQSNANYGVIAGGFKNSIGTNSGTAFIGGGYQNVIGGNATAAVLGGGDQNVVEPNAAFATLSGGGVNLIRSNANSATIAGGEVNQISLNAHHAAIGGGRGNLVQFNAAGTTIGGGNNNVAGGSYSTVSGGSGNLVNGDYGVVGGGISNSNWAYYGTISGGQGNLVNAFLFATISGGANNIAQNDYGNIGGGLLNTNQGNVSTIGGGQQNTTYGGASTVPGGTLNLAGGDYSFAAGRRAKANDLGSFVWADSDAGSANGADFVSTAFDQFLIRAGGGVGINTNNPAGASLAVVGGIRNGRGGTLQSRVEFGTANVGTGASGVNTFTITFPTAFATIPKVFVVARGNDNPDTFAVSTRAVTTNSFKVNIVRVDIASGWGQALNVDWYATE